MKFTCPSCNASLTAQPEHAGKTVRCPGCDNKLTIPIVIMPKVVTTGPATAGKSVSGAAGSQGPIPAVTKPQTGAPAGSKSSTDSSSPGERSGWVETDPANPNIWMALGIGMGIFAAMHLVGLVLMRTYIFTILFQRGWVNFAESFVFAWGAGILVLKYQKLQHQKNALLLDVLPERIGRDISRDNIEKFVDHVYNLPVRLRDSLMVNRIRKALELFESRQDTGSVAHMMSTQSEIDSIRIAGSYSLLKVFIWAIPILGFIGTVLGLSAAIGNFSGVMGTSEDFNIDNMMSSLGGVTSGLGTSFDTTLLGLVYSIFLSFPLSGLQKSEEDNLNNIDAYCNETLLPRLDGSGDAAAAGDLGAVLDVLVTKMTKAQGQYLSDLNSTSTLVREQVENLEARAKEQSEFVQKTFVETMQTLNKTTAHSLEANVNAVNGHVKALAQALTTLNNVLQAIGERQVQVEVPRPGFFRRLFGKR